MSTVSRQPPPAAIGMQQGPPAAPPPADASDKKPVKKYKCTYCDRGFSRSEHRNRHERSHTKERPYHCQKCPSTFVRRDLLLRHDRTVHANKFPQNAASDTLEILHGLARGVPATQYAKKLDTGSNSAVFKSNRSVYSALKEEPENMPSVQHIERIGHQHELSNEPQLQYSSMHHPDAHLAHLTHRHNRSLSPQNHIAKPSSQITLPPLQKTSSPPLMASSINTPASQYFLTPPISNANLAGTNLTNSSIGAIPRAYSSSSSAPQLSALAHAASSTDQSPMNTDLESALMMTQLQREKERKASPTQFYSSLPQFRSIAHLHAKFKVHPESLSSGMQLKTLTLTQVNKYLAGYFLVYHEVLPFMSKNSLDLINMAPSLLFALCAVGAMVCNEPEVGAQMHTNSRLVLKDCPALELVQAITLQLVFVAWSMNEIQAADCPSLVHLAQQLLDEEYFQNEHSHAHWVHNEALIRTYFTVFIVVNKLSSIFSNHAVFSTDRVPNYLPIPSPDADWDAPGKEYTQSHANAPKFHQILNSIHQFKQHQTSCFANNVLYHALFLGLTNPGFQSENMRASLNLLNESTMALASSEPSSNHMLLKLLQQVSKSRDFRHGLDYDFTQMCNLRYFPVAIFALRTELSLCVPYDAVSLLRSQDVAKAALATLDSLTTTGAFRDPKLTAFVYKLSEIFRMLVTLGISLVQPELMSMPVNAMVHTIQSSQELILLFVIWVHCMENTKPNIINDGEHQLFCDIREVFENCGLEKLQERMAPGICLFFAQLFEERFQMMSLTLKSVAYQLL